jgi:4-amino-4-deoxy-L-arabinose transferase-like glycosyltransferase
MKGRKVNKPIIMSGTYRKIAGFASLIVLVNALVLLTDWTLARYLGALLLLCLLPGYALVDLIFARSRPQSGPLEKVALSVGISYVLSSLATLLVHYIPGKITLTQALVAYDLLILIPLAPGCLIAPSRPSTQPPDSPTTEPPNYLWLIALLALSAFFRFTYLGYSDFQGDEALVMLTAADAIEGRDYALFAHGKSPGEVLIPIAFWLTAGRINELAARLPFALAGCLAVLITCLLGWRMFNKRVGLAAGALLAINGFFVGFGRIVQYQTLVFAMTALALYCYYRFYTDDMGEYQILGALFLGFGLLAHYDAVLALPAILYLYWAKSGLKLTQYQRHILPLVLSLVLLISIPIAFYLPFVRDPQFAKSASYISQSRVGGNVLSNNLSQFCLLSTIYNSTYYFAFMALLLLWVVVKGLHHWPGGCLWPCLAVAAMASVLAFPDAWQVGKVNLSVVPFALTWLALHASRKTSTELKTALIWFAAPLVFYIFLISYPLTHVYNLYPGWVLLSGVALDGLWQTKPGLRYALGAAGIVLYAVFAYYILFVFVIHEPEYIRTYPTHRNRFYWTAYDELPQAGYFGFPYRAGWKAVGELQEGVLQGEYGSNEEREITTWYTRRAPRSCSPEPDYYYIAENVADEQEIPWDSLATEYTLWGTVLVGNTPKLRIYQRLPAQTDATTYPVENFETAYDLSATPESLAEKTIPDHLLSVNLSHKVKLLGYDLDTREARPGGALVLTLYWQALAKMDVSYHAFTHLESDHIWGQSDGVPDCWRCPTTEWRPGQVITDRRRIPLDPQTPAGPHPLLVGMYELESGRRLEVIDEAGNPQAQSVLLTEITLE